MGNEEGLTENEHVSTRHIPDSMKKKQAMAYNQNYMAQERTELSKIRTDLAFHNSRLANEQTHLAYLRTIVSLIGSGATVYKALPMLGLSKVFCTFLTLFLLGFAVYFIYKDMTTYPQMKRFLDEKQKMAIDLEEKAESQVYEIDDR